MTKTVARAIADDVAAHEKQIQMARVNKAADKIADKLNFTGKIGALVDALKFVAPAISTEETRYYLRSVLFELNSSGLHVVATDGHRLHHTTIAGHEDARLKNSVAASYRFLLKGDDAREIIKAYNSKKAQGDKTYRLDFGAMMFFAGHKSFTDYVDARFPDWQRVVPHTTEPIVHVPGDALLPISQAAIAAGERGRAVKFTMDKDNGRLKLTASHHHFTPKMAKGSHNVEMLAEFECEVTARHETGFQAAYLIDIVEAFGRYSVLTMAGEPDYNDGPKLWHHIGDSANPKGGQYIVIMPVRV